MCVGRAEREGEKQEVRRGEGKKEEGRGGERVRKRERKGERGRTVNVCVHQGTQWESGVLVLNFPFTRDKQAITHPFIFDGQVLNWKAHY